MQEHVYNLVLFILITSLSQASKFHYNHHMLQKQLIFLLIWIPWSGGSLEWWKLHSSELPSWSSAAKKALLVQPSSGSAERIFLILKSSFGNLQDRSFKDYIEASFMLQYNKRY